MNFLQLQNATRERCGLTPNDQMMTPANAAAIVNSALHDLETRKPAGWPWAYRTFQIQTVLGQAVYPFASLQTAPNVWMKIREVRLLYAGIVWQRLATMNISMVRKTYPSLTPSLPFAWSTDGYQLVLGPIPNDVYTLELDVVIAEPDLVADTDTPMMPPTFHHAIVDLGAALEFRRLMNTAAEQLARADVTTAVGEMLAWSRTRTGPGSQKIRDPYE